jgi:predicted amidohydrolase YtcJ
MQNVVIAAVAALVSSPAFADTLVYNVNGIQVGTDSRLQRFGGLVIDDEGKVERLIDRPEELNRPIEREVDGGGRTLLPGLIDAHVHLTQLGLTTTQIALNDTKSLKELKAQLRQFAAEHPDQRWITGRGWNEEAWPEKQTPTAADLDSVVPDRPVWLYRVDGHGAVANSAALREAGISRNTADPAGGRIFRDPAGNPTGFLIDKARELVESRIPPASEAEQDSTMLAAQDILLADGITSVGNMRTSVDDWHSLKRLGNSGRLQIRVAGFAHGLEAMNGIGEPGPTAWLFADRLRLAGVKFYADGALGSRGAWLKRPYADAPDTSGLSLQSDADLERDASIAARRGFQVAIHAIGDAANAQAIRTLEKLGRTYPGDRRWRIEHFQIVDPADIHRLAPAGITASMQPVHQVSDRLMAEKRLGNDRLAGAYAWQSVLRSGARLAFGSDAPFDTPNPFVGLSAAISRQDMEGQPPGGWIPTERLTFAQALNAFTRGAAYAGFAEDKIGALEPGKWADFIIVDRDPTKVDPQALARTQVLETWVAGKKVWERTSAAGAERGR